MSNRSLLPLVSVWVLPCLLTLPPGAPSIAAEGDQPPHSAGAPAVPRQFTREHKGRFNGVSMDYIATAREVIQRDPEGRAAASLFGFSYVRKPTGDPAQRPVTFVFHGGPGASSYMMHMGVFGPVRLAVPEGSPWPAAAPYRMVDNDGSPLDVTDLVFIDPVETGFSRLLKDGKRADYIGTVQDAISVANFIRTWLTENGRWSSPKFVIGESYGTIRATLVARELVGGLASGELRGIPLNGIVLYGQVLNRADLEVVPGHGNDRGYELLVPTMAAIAWYHAKVDRGGRSLEEFVAQAQEFAASEYSQALFAGDTLDGAARHRVAERYAQLTGLPVDFVLSKDLRVTAEEFAGKLLEDRGQVVGLYDGRCAARAPVSSPDLLDDPSLAQLLPAFSAALHDELRTRFGMALDEDYWLVNFAVDRDPLWSKTMGLGGVSFVSFSGLLGSAMRQNPDLHILIGSGYYDLVTNMAAARYMGTHAGLVAERVWIKRYEAGHVAFIGDGPRAAVQHDLRAFIRNAIRPH